jgi:hypothetical protein
MPVPARPAARPAARQVARPAARQVARPAAKPVARPAARPAARPVAPAPAAPKKTLSPLEDVVSFKKGPGGATSCVTSINADKWKINPALPLTADNICQAKKKCLEDEYKNQDMYACYKPDGTMKDPNSFKTCLKTACNVCVKTPCATKGGVYKYPSQRVEQSVPGTFFYRNPDTLQTLQGPLTAKRSQELEGHEWAMLPQGPEHVSTIEKQNAEIRAKTERLGKSRNGGKHNTRKSRKSRKQRKSRKSRKSHKRNRRH